MIGRAQLAVVEHDEEAQSPTNQKSVADELEIRRVVDEIDNSCDAKDWKRCRSFFADEIDVDFTSLAGGKPARIKADALIDAWRKNLFEAKKTCHLRSNHSIEITGDGATVFSKAYAFNLLERGRVKGLWEVWGNYTHTLERTAGGWKVSAMTLAVIYQRGNGKVREYIPKNKR